MSRRVDALLAEHLAQCGALGPAKLGGTRKPPPADQAIFMQALAACRRSVRVQVIVLTVMHLASLALVLALLFRVVTSGSDTLVTTVLGGSAVAALGIVPLRLQALWKDLATLKLLLAVLPGRSDTEQIDLVKAIYLSGRSGSGTA